MITNLKYICIKKTNFIYNSKNMVELYGPIIGKEAIYLYEYLLSEAESQWNFRNASYYVNDMLKTSMFTSNQFSESRNKLEAIGLMNTYLNDDQKLLTFELVNPLIFNDFIQNQKFRHLLISKIGNINYDKLVFFNTPYKIKNAKNISASFEIIYGNDELNKIKTFNFEELYKIISKKTNIPVILSSKDKEIIESYFTNYNITINEIASCIYSSIIKNNDIFEISSDLLLVKLQTLVNSINNLNIFKNIKINRNANLFIKALSPEETNKIFNDYKNLNSEQYLNAITKQELTQEEKNIIQKLRNKYHLSDCLINVIFDHSIFRTNKICSNYIYKVANTINLRSIDSLENIIDHLRNYGKKINYSFEQIKNNENYEQKELIMEEWK